jgi:hypothetical protein
MSKANIGGYEFETTSPAELQTELNSAFGHHFSHHVRDMYRGVKAVRLPVLTATAGGTTLLIPSSGGAEPIACGPQQGYFWRIGRVTVSSNGSDTGAVSLFAGSDATNVGQQFLIDNTLKVGQAYYPGTRGLFLWPGEQLYVSLTSVASNTYRLTGVAIEVPAEMAGKILV